LSAAADAVGVDEEALRLLGAALTLAATSAKATAVMTASRRRIRRPWRSGDDVMSWCCVNTFASLSRRW
jgi:hypothetical protein